LTFGVRDTTDAIFGDPETFSNDVFTAANTHLKPLLASFVSMNGVGFEDVRTVPYTGATYSQTPFVGTFGGTIVAIPTSTCLSVKKITAALGRSGRGRWYWPIWANNELSGADAVSTVHANAIITAIVAWSTAVQTATYPVDIGVISTEFGGVPRVAGVFEEITIWTYADTNVDSQRRRLVGRGR
jgi:hypothetical protein